MRVIAIDPGIATTGYSIIEKRGNKFFSLDHGAIITKPHTPVSCRLKIIHDELKQLIETYQPEQMAIEALFFNTNAKTAILVGQARGVVILGASLAGLEVFDYTPLQVKNAVCGYGHADKKQVQYMVKYFLNLESAPRPDDVSDAIAVGICHLNSSTNRWI